MPWDTSPHVHRGMREMLPGERLAPEEPLKLLEAEQGVNERANLSYAKHRSALRRLPGHPL